MRTHLLESSGPLESSGTSRLSRRRLSVLSLPALFLLAAVFSAPQAHAQLVAKALPSRIAGAVLIDGESQPAARVRVDVKALGGGDLASTFTDASGRFEAATEGEGPVIVAVAENGYEPVQQQLDLAHGAYLSGVVITLRKLKAALQPKAAPLQPKAEPLEPATFNGYTVSVHNLKIPNKARRAFEKGLERLQKKDAQGSLPFFQEATSVYPDYYEAYYQIGVADMELRRGPEAEQALQRSIDLSGGGYARPEFALGALLCDRQDYSDAERVIRRGLDVDSNSWEGHMLLGQVQFGQRKLADAEKSAHEVLLRRPDLATAYILLANVHIIRKEFTTAISELDTFLAMRPQGPTSDQARAVRAAALRIASRLEQTITLPTFIY